MQLLTFTQANFYTFSPPSFKLIRWFPEAEQERKWWLFAKAKTDFQFNRLLRTTAACSFKTTIRCWSRNVWLLNAGQISSWTQQRKAEPWQLDPTCNRLPWPGIIKKDGTRVQAVAQWSKFFQLKWERIQPSLFLWKFSFSKKQEF